MFGLGPELQKCWDYSDCQEYICLLLTVPYAITSESMCQGSDLGWSPMLLEEEAVYQKDQGIGGIGILSPTNLPLGWGPGDQAL